MPACGTQTIVAFKEPISSNADRRDYFEVFVFKVSPLPYFVTLDAMVLHGKNPTEAPVNP